MSLIHIASPWRVQIQAWYASPVQPVCLQWENGPRCLEKPLLGVTELGGGYYQQSGLPAHLLNKLLVEVSVYFHACVRETPWMFHSTHEVAQ